MSGRLGQVSSYLAISIMLFYMVDAANLKEFLSLDARSGSFGQRARRNRHSASASHCDSEDLSGCKEAKGNGESSDLLPGEVLKQSGCLQSHIRDAHGVFAKLCVQGNGNLELFEHFGGMNSPIWRSNSNQDGGHGQFALMLTSEGDLVILRAAVHGHDDDNVLQALAAAKEAGQLQEIWSRSASAAGRIKRLHITKRGNVEIQDYQHRVIWETRTEIKSEWADLLMDFGWYSLEDMNGWERYTKLRRGYSQDFWSTHWMVDLMRQDGMGFCGEGDVTVCEDVGDSASSLRPGQLITQGHSLRRVITTMTVDGNFLQGLRKGLNVVLDFAADFEIPTRSGVPYLNVVDTKLTVQSDGNLVLYMRETSCSAWYDEDEDKFYSSKMEIKGGAYNCATPGVVCKCRDNQDRDLAKELEYHPYRPLWSTETSVTDESDRNGPYALVLTSAGDLTLIDGDGAVTWREDTGDAGPITCATVVGVKRRPNDGDWEDSQVNFNVYRADTRHPRDPCTEAAAVQATMADPHMVWSTVTVPGDSVTNPLGKHGQRLIRFRARTDNPFSPTCTVQQLDQCEDVPEGSESMHSGYILREGKSLEVPLGRLTMYTDGNLVLYLGRNKAVWSSFTHAGSFHEDTDEIKERKAKQKGPYALVMTSMAEMAIVDGGGQILWFVDSLKLYNTLVTPDKLGALDKVMSPTTLIADVFDRGITAAFSSPAEVFLVTSPAHSFPRWRFHLQWDGNAVLFAAGQEPVFRTNTAEWHEEDDKWPQAVLSDYSLYGSAWTRFNPASGDSFFQWSKFLSQFVSELVGDVALSLLTGGSYAVAKFTVKFGAKAAIKMAKATLLAGAKSALKTASKVVMSPVQLARYVARAGAKGVAKDIGSMIKIVAKSVKSAAIKVARGLKHGAVGIKVGANKLAKVFAKSPARAKYLGVLGVCKTAVIGAVKGGMKVGKFVVKAPWVVFKNAAATPMELANFGKSLGILAHYGGKQAVSKVLRKTTYKAGTGVIKDVVQQAGEQAIKTHLIRSLDAPLKAPGQSAASKYIDDLFQKGLDDVVDGVAPYKKSKTIGSGSSRPADDAIVPGYKSKPDPDAVGVPYRPLGAKSKPVPKAKVGSAPPTTSITDLYVPSLPRKVKTPDGVQLDLGRLLDNLDGDLAMNKKYYEAMDGATFPSTGKIGAYPLEEQRHLAKQSIELNANFARQHAIVEYGDALAAQGLDADAVLKQHVGMTLSQARQADDAYAMAMLWYVSPIQGVPKKDVDSIFVRPGTYTRSSPRKPGQPFEWSAGLELDANGKFDSFREGLDDLFMPINPLGIDVDVSHSMTLKYMYVKSPLASNPPADNLAFKHASELADLEYEATMLSAASVFVDGATDMGADPSIALKYIGVEADPAAVAKRLKKVEAKVAQKRKELLQSVQFDVGEWDEMQEVLMDRVRKDMGGSVEDGEFLSEMAFRSKVADEMASGRLNDEMLAEGTSTIKHGEPTIVEGYAGSDGLATTGPKRRGAMRSVNSQKVKMQRAPVDQRSFQIADLQSLPREYQVVNDAGEEIVLDLSHLADEYDEMLKANRKLYAKIDSRSFYEGMDPEITHSFASSMNRIMATGDRYVYMSKYADEAASKGIDKDTFLKVQFGTSTAQLQKELDTFTAAQLGVYFNAMEMPWTVACWDVQDVVGSLKHRFNTGELTAVAERLQDARLVLDPTYLPFANSACLRQVVDTQSDAVFETGKRLALQEAEAFRLNHAVELLDSADAMGADLEYISKHVLLTDASPAQIRYARDAADAAIPQARREWQMLYDEASPEDLAREYKRMGLEPGDSTIDYIEELYDNLEELSALPDPATLRRKPGVDAEDAVPAPEFQLDESSVKELMETGPTDPNAKGSVGGLSDRHVEDLQKRLSYRDGDDVIVIEKQIGEDGTAKLVLDDSNSKVDDALDLDMEDRHTFVENGENTDVLGQDGKLYLEDGKAPDADSIVNAPHALKPPKHAPPLQGEAWLKESMEGGVMQMQPLPSSITGPDGAAIDMSHLAEEYDKVLQADKSAFYHLEASKEWKGAAEALAVSEDRVRQAALDLTQVGAVFRYQDALLKYGQELVDQGLDAAVVDDIMLKNFGATMQESREAVRQYKLAAACGFAAPQGNVLAVVATSKELYPMRLLAMDAADDLAAYTKLVALQDVGTHRSLMATASKGCSVDDAADSLAWAKALEIVDIDRRMVDVDYVDAVIDVADEAKADPDLLLDVAVFGGASRGQVLEESDRLAMESATKYYDFVGLWEGLGEYQQHELVSYLKNAGGVYEDVLKSIIKHAEQQYVAGIDVVKTLASKLGMKLLRKSRNTITKKLTLKILASGGARAEREFVRQKIKYDKEADALLQVGVGASSTRSSDDCSNTNMEQCDIRSQDVNDNLRRGQGIASPFALRRHGITDDDGDWHDMDLRMYSDGNLVLYETYDPWGFSDRKTVALWDSSDDNDKYHVNGVNQPHTLLLDGDGDLMVLGENKLDVKWRIEGSTKRPVDRLDVYSDGNVVLYRHTGEWIWATRTNNFDSVGAWDFYGTWNSDLDGLNYQPGDVVCDPKAHWACEEVLPKKHGGVHITMFPGERLLQGQSLRSHVDGGVRLEMYGDGNLVLYKHGKSIWHTGTYGEGEGPYTLIFDVRGVLHVVDKHGESLWDHDDVWAVALEIHDGEPKLMGYDGKDSGSEISRWWH